MFKIKPNSIINLSKKFSAFEKSLEGADYVVHFDCVKFQHNSNSLSLTIDSLKTIYPNEDIQGELYVSNLEELKQKVEHFRKSIVQQKKEQTNKVIPKSKRVY